MGAEGKQPHARSLALAFGGFRVRSGIPPPTPQMLIGLSATPTTDFNTRRMRGKGRMRALPRGISMAVSHLPKERLPFQVPR